MRRIGLGPRSRSLTRPESVPVRDRLIFSHSEVQRFDDHWRHTIRVCDYMGRCLNCGRRTYAFRDGENDPRGPLGDHAYWPVTADDNEYIELRACAICANDEPSYRAIQARYAS